MYTIIKGYKQGRGILFYDLLDSSNKVNEMVPKETVVKLCENGEIKDTKIQWWEGKPIVRCSNKNLPVVKITESQDKKKTEVKICSQTDKSNTVNNEVASNGVIVAKLGYKKKRETAFNGMSGYDRNHLYKQTELKKSINYNKLVTIEDLFISIANDYNIKDVDLYIKEFSKKVDINKKIKGLSIQYLYAIQNSINEYLVNMVYREVNEIYLKYMVV